MIPDDVQRQYREADMWHTQAELAHARREHDSDIDAYNDAQEEEDLDDESV